MLRTAMMIYHLHVDGWKTSFSSAGCQRSLRHGQKETSATRMLCDVLIIRSRALRPRKNWLLPQLQSWADRRWQHRKDLSKKGRRRTRKKWKRKCVAHGDSVLLDALSSHSLHQLQGKQPSLPFRKRWSISRSRPKRQSQASTRYAGSTPQEALVSQALLSIRTSHSKAQFNACHWHTSFCALGSKEKLLLKKRSINKGRPRLGSHWRSIMYIT